MMTKVADGAVVAAAVEAAADVVEVASEVVAVETQGAEGKVFLCGSYMCFPDDLLYDNILIIKS